MKKILLLTLLMIGFVGFSQEKQPSYTAEGDLVKATYYYQDGTVSTIGFFKDQKLTGEWTRFDKEGNIIQTAFYDAGNKVGKWLVWSSNALKEIHYENNAIVDVNTRETGLKIAIH
jgi:antitoxin component YwqK of YwqJK toxin-antitoxin module